LSSVCFSKAHSKIVFLINKKALLSVIRGTLGKVIFFKKIKTFAECQIAGTRQKGLCIRNHPSSLDLIYLSSSPAPVVAVSSPPLYHRWRLPLGHHHRLTHASARPPQHPASIATVAPGPRRLGPHHHRADSVSRV
jgi:hypothetical protein